MQSEVNVRGEKLLPGRRLATAVPRYNAVEYLIKGLGNENRFTSLPTVRPTRGFFKLKLTKIVSVVFVVPLHLEKTCAE